MFVSGFDAVSFLQNRLAPAEVDVRRCQNFPALMVALVVVVLDEARDLRLEITRITLASTGRPPLGGPSGMFSRQVGIAIERRNRPWLV
jgi:hypothetical protein